jgi:hypothetical protein
MFDSSLVEVVLGVLFVFILLSILTTEINSVISNLLKLRAKHLRQGIALLIEDEEMQARIITHPLIKLSEARPVLPDQRLDEADIQKIVNGSVTALSNIDPNTFVNVLIDLIRVDSDQELYSAMLSIVDAMPDGPERRRLRLAIDNITKTGDGLDDLHEAIAAVSSDVYRSALNKMLSQINQEIERQTLDGDNLTALIAGVRKLTDPYLKNALNTILATSYNVQQARDELEKWFNGGMDRATARFSSTMQWLSLTVGLLTALLLNIDTLQLSSALWNDPALRASVAAAAEAANLEAMVAEAAQRQAELEGSENAGATGDPQEQDLEDIAADVGESAAAAQQTLDQLLDLRLPIGWYYRDLSEMDRESAENDVYFSDSRNLWNFWPPNNTDWLLLVFWKFLGLAATGFAAAQGAPFWFNILRRLSGR